MRRIILIWIAFLVFGVNLFSQSIKTTLTYSVHLPAKKTNKTPVLILLHGYGSNEEDLFDMGKVIDPKFIVFTLRAPITTKEGGYCWYNLDFLPNQQFKYSYEEAKESRNKLLSFISNACKAYQVDSTQVFLLGFSQGAIMSYDMALSAPKKIKGLVALSGRLMTETKDLQFNATDLSKVKIFIAHGNSDNVIKIEEADKANAFFKSKNVSDLTFKKYEMPHSISGGELNDIRAWLVKAITPVKKTPSTTK